MTDTIVTRFLKDQCERGMALAANSDVLDLVAMHDREDVPPQHYIAMYHCKSALRLRTGQIRVTESQFDIGIFFGQNHLRAVDPLRLVTWLGPANIVHPNIRPPFVCLGRIYKGIALVDILYQVFEIITYVNWSSHDSLDATGAQWARNHQQLFPVDRKTLVRRKPSRD